MPPKSTKEKTPTAQTAGVSGAQNQNFKERTKRMDSNAESSKTKIAYEGHWEGVTRTLFPDLNDKSRGNVIAVDLLGVGVVIGSSCDPALYVLMLDKRCKLKGVKMGAALVTTPVQKSHVQTRQLIYQLNETRAEYAGIVKRSFELVKRTIEANFEQGSPA